MTRHAASLRPSGIGRIGFKPPHSKRGTAAKGLCGQSIFKGGFGKQFLITQFHFSKSVATRRAASFCVSATENPISIN